MTRRDQLALARKSVREWRAVAIEAEAQNAELRRMMTALILAIGRNAELLRFAECELAACREERAA